MNKARRALANVWCFCSALLCPAHPLYLLDLVAWTGDALCNALVSADGSSELSVVLNNQFIQVMITFLICLFQAALLRLPVCNIITGGQGPKTRQKSIMEEIVSHDNKFPIWKPSIHIFNIYYRNYFQKIYLPEHLPPPIITAQVANS